MAKPEEEDDFKLTAELPVMWQITARQLITSANLLREGHEAAKEKVSFYASKMPFLLLYGLAAENLIKGLLVAQGVAPVVDGRLSESIKGHDLVRLYEGAGFQLSADEKDVLNSLSWVVQGGKYPVATKPAIYPRDPTPTWLALTNLDRVGRLLKAAEDKLRAVGGKWILGDTELMKLGLT